MMNNVSHIVNQNLCCSCSACGEVCGNKAITYAFQKGIFVPIVSSDQCTNCGRCMRVCPSAEMGITSMYENPDIFGVSEKESYIAYSTDSVIRHYSTSGGCVTTMVKTLLDKGVYQRAFLLEYNSFDGKASLSPFIKGENIQKASKSKYIPASVDRVVASIRKGEISKSIIVCTPCQLLAIKKSLLLYQRLEDEILFIGLFCDKTLNYNIYRYYQQRYGDYSQLNFRDKEGNGWPGDTTIVQDAKTVIIPRTVRMSLKPFFELNRCRHCFDKLNQLADISIGDCYISGNDDSLGKSNIIIRTDKGRKALLQCEGKLSLQSCEFYKIKESQHIDDKKKNLIRSLDEPITSEMELGLDLSSATQCNQITEQLSTKSRKTGRYIRLMHRLFQFAYHPDNSYYVYIINAGFNNRGDQLMIQALVEQIHVWKPAAKILLSERAYNQNRSYCYENSILPLFTPNSRWKKIKTKFCVNNLLNRHTYVTPDQVDLVLDASGFQFGDQWSYCEDDIIDRKQFYDTFTKKGRKFIILPQALGPFEKDLSKRLFQLAYANADRVFARDATSYNYALGVVEDSKKLSICPDFTILTKSKSAPAVQYPPKSYVLVIANARMIDKTDDATSMHYLDFMVAIIQMLIDKGEMVLLLNHEGLSDEELLHTINSRLSSSLPIITHLSGLDIKAIIGQSKLTISSRYHGVVSGLVQNVPTLCTSWNHKYMELLNDHECPDNMLDICDINKSKTHILDALENPKKYSSKVNCNNSICIQVNKMWQEVFSL